MTETKSSVYPHFVVENNKKPNRFLNFPFLGVLIKIILLIPILIEALFLGIAAFFMLVISWFVVSFTGNYWTTAYKFFLGTLRFGTKIQLYLFGITDKYPGFKLNTNDLFELTFDKPEKPNKWLAIPLLGFFVRCFLLIPYFIFRDVLERGAGVALFLSWFVILFKGRLPETLYEFERDSLRVSLASSIYIMGLSDKYPSYAISMNHQTGKIWLVIIGAILGAFNLLGSAYEEPESYQSGDYNYEYEVSPGENIDIDYSTY